MSTKAERFSELEQCPGDLCQNFVRIPGRHPRRLPPPENTFGANGTLGLCSILNERTQARFLSLFGESFGVQKSRYLNLEGT